MEAESQRASPAQTRTHTAARPDAPSPGAQPSVLMLADTPRKAGCHPLGARRRHQLPARDIPVTPCEMSPACPSAPSCHSPWRSSLQSFPGGLSWPICLGICCQHGQVLTGAPAAGCDISVLPPARPLACCLGCVTLSEEGPGSLHCDSTAVWGCLSHLSPSR